MQCGRDAQHSARAYAERGIRHFQICLCLRLPQLAEGLVGRIGGLRIQTTCHLTPRNLKRGIQSLFDPCKGGSHDIAVMYGGELLYHQIWRDNLVQSVDLTINKIIWRALQKHLEVQLGSICDSKMAATSDSSFKFP